MHRFKGSVSKQPEENDRKDHQRPARGPGIHRAELRRVTHPDLCEKHFHLQQGWDGEMIHGENDRNHEHQCHDPTRFRPEQMAQQGPAMERGFGFPKLARNPTPRSVQRQAGERPEVESHKRRRSKGSHALGLRSPQANADPGPGLHPSARAEKWRNHEGHGRPNPDKTSQPRPEGLHRQRHRGPKTYGKNSRSKRDAKRISEKSSAHVGSDGRGSASFTARPLQRHARQGTPKSPPPH